MEFSTDPVIDIAVHDDANALTQLLQRPVTERAAALAAHEDLVRAWEIQRSAAPGMRHPTRVDVQLSLGNPDNPMFVNQTLGYYGMGSMPGLIWLVTWPADYNLPRIGAAQCTSSPTISATRTSPGQARWASGWWRKASRKPSPCKSAAPIRRGAGTPGSPSTPSTQPGRRSHRRWVPPTTPQPTFSGMRRRRRWAAQLWEYRTWRLRNRPADRRAVPRGHRQSRSGGDDRFHRRNSGGFGPQHGGVEVRAGSRTNCFDRELGGDQSVARLHTWRRQGRGRAGGPLGRPRDRFVTRVARYHDLPAALDAADLGPADEVTTRLQEPLP